MSSAQSWHIILKKKGELLYQLLPQPTRVWKKAAQWQKAFASAALTSQKVFLQRPLSGPSPLWSLREQTGLISLPPSPFQILEDFCPRSSLFQTSISHCFHCFFLCPDFEGLCLHSSHTCGQFDCGSFRVCCPRVNQMFVIPSEQSRPRRAYCLAVKK